MRVTVGRLRFVKSSAGVFGIDGFIVHALVKGHFNLSASKLLFLTNKIALEWKAAPL